MWKLWSISWIKQKCWDYNTAFPEGSVLDIIGDTEVSAPEMLNFNPVLRETDMWAVGVLAYTLASGISPFFHANEDSLFRAVSSVQYEFDENNDLNGCSSDLKISSRNVFCEFLR